MRAALLIVALTLGGCVAMPEPGAMTQAKADQTCQGYALQHDSQGWGLRLLGPLGDAAEVDHIKEAPEYGECMAHAGYADAKQ